MFVYCIPVRQHQTEYLKGIDVVRNLELIQLPLNVRNHLLLELGAAQQVECHTSQQHVDGMLNGYRERLSCSLATYTPTMACQE